MFTSFSNTPGLNYVFHYKIWTQNNGHPVQYIHKLNNCLYSLTTRICYNVQPIAPYHNDIQNELLVSKLCCKNLTKKVIFIVITALRKHFCNGMYQLPKCLNDYICQPPGKNKISTKFKLFLLLSK